MISKKITQTSGNKITGSFTPMAMYGELMQEFEIDLNLRMAIHEIKFDDPITLQEFKNDIMTGYRFYVVVIKGGIKLSFLEMGDNYMAVYLVDGDEVNVAPIYADYKFIKRPDRDKLVELFQSIPEEY